MDVIYILSSFLMLGTIRGFVPFVSGMIDKDAAPLTTHAIRSSVGALIFVLFIGMCKVCRSRSTNPDAWTALSCFWISPHHQENSSSARPPRFLLKMIIIAITQGQLPLILVPFANLLGLDGAVASVILAMTPVCTCLMHNAVAQWCEYTQLRYYVTPLQRRTYSRWTYGGLAAGFIGLLLVAIPGMLYVGSSTTITSIVVGLPIMIIAMLSWSFAGNFNEIALPASVFYSTTKSFYQILIGSLLAWILSLTIEFNWGYGVYLDHFGWIHDISVTNWMLIVFFLGVAMSFLAVAFQTYLIDTIQASKTSLVWYMVPVVGLLADVVLGNSWAPMPIWARISQCVGCSVIAIGLGYTSYRDYRQKREVAEQVERMEDENPLHESLL